MLVQTGCIKGYLNNKQKQAECYHKMHFVSFLYGMHSGEMTPSPDVLLRL